MTTSRERRLTEAERRANATTAPPAPPKLCDVDVSPERCGVILEILHGAGVIETETPEALAKLRRGIPA